MVGRNEHSLIILFHTGYCLTSVFVNFVNVWSVFQLVFCHDFQHCIRARLHMSVLNRN